MNLAAVIVAYNSSGHIGACLDSCLAFAPSFPSGIIVVDNASTDDTLHHAAQRDGVTLLANTTNLGFAGAVNQGFVHAFAADAVLVLNPDVVLVQPPDELVRQLQEPRTAAAAGLLLDPSGTPQTGFLARRFPTPAALIFEVLGLNRLWPGNPVNRRYRYRDLDLSQPAPVEQPPAACLLIRRQAWLDARGFDESFHPVWFEDVDFLKRLATLNWHARFTPGFQARHAGGHSFAGIGWGQRQLYWYGSLLRYAIRHFSTPAWLILAGSVLIGLLPRTVTVMFLQRSCRPLTMYVKVVRLLFESLRRGRVTAHSNQLVPPPVSEERRASGS